MPWKGWEKPGRYRINYTKHLLKLIKLVRKDLPSACPLAETWSWRQSMLIFSLSTIFIDDYRSNFQGRLLLIRRHRRTWRMFPQERGISTEWWPEFDTKNPNGKRRFKKKTKHSFRLSFHCHISWYTHISAPTLNEKMQSCFQRDIERCEIWRKSRKKGKKREMKSLESVLQCELED